MAKHRHHDREQYPISRMAIISPVIALLTIFMCLVVWPISADWVLILVGPFAGTGLYLARKARKRIARHHNAIRGDEAATIGFYLNLVLLFPGILVLAALRFMGH